MYCSGASGVCIIDILISNRKIANNYMNISNNESMFEYYEVIIFAVDHKAFWALLNLITSRPKSSPHPSISPRAILYSLLQLDVFHFTVNGYFKKIIIFSSL